MPEYSSSDNLSRRCLRQGFSFIEMVTVVAIISIVVSSAVPIASSLYQRRRELVLRETLLLMRRAIRDFSQNQRDDDTDGETDEDSFGDRNLDGFPGIRGVDDNGDLFVDDDWGRRNPFLTSGLPNLAYDWKLRADDDEDKSNDEEAHAENIFDLVDRSTILRGRIPRDPTTGQPSWDEVFLQTTTAPSIRTNWHRANNDLDWYVTADQSILSTDNVFQAAQDIVLNGTTPANLTALLPKVDEDPRNGKDDDGDGRIDEDPWDLTDVASLNSDLSTALTTYSDW